jgi:hypothetical protein
MCTVNVCLCYRNEIGFVGKLTGNIESVLLKKCVILVHASVYFLSFLTI